MATEKKISRIVSSIIAQCSPEKVILFGSHAYGTPTKDSDIDLFIVADIPGLPAERVRLVRRAIKEQASVDIVVRSPKDIETSLKGRDWFVQEVFEKGRVLYER
ncbi:MAG: nucleotidyltransferase domain-containing protein [Ignavibacteriales bacterium]|nr:nucleotidyltransferase domain-containing protein [Ignavibacteriales bacterium]